MSRSVYQAAIERLARLKASSECVVYFNHVPFDNKLGVRLSVYGILTTREIFIVLTDGKTTRVKSFTSRLNYFPDEIRRVEIPLVDLSDAFIQARLLKRRWPGTHWRDKPSDPLPSRAARDQSLVPEPAELAGATAGDPGCFDSPI